MSEPYDIDRAMEKLRADPPTAVCFRCFERKPVDGPFCAACWAAIEIARAEQVEGESLMDRSRRDAERIERGERESGASGF